jgi:pantothenate kinase
LKAIKLANQIIQRFSGSQRVLIAIAGPPGSGKSTLAQKVCGELMQSGTKAMVVPMDGFHLDNSVLDQMGMRHRKGAPETFDAGGFIDHIRAIHENKQPIRIPGFDRGLDAVIDGDKMVDTSDRVILIEGNYLLLDEIPWTTLRRYFDMTIFINPGLGILQNRLVQRWLDFGLSQADAESRAFSNDIPNAERVLKNSIAADVLIGHAQ